ncbi:hypothetical protein DBV15_04582 [Temnothorax longispinosus]|uniref:Uncharacterized protein n=1 Tax=Temnothorax longispinosus TaxID=300112 RepID=A0A4S2KFH4_9HYME|nr:hypothetical protein DBV15_04582 [Temnothorax longispinosus]
MSYVLRKTMFCHNLYILPCIPVTPSNIALSRQVVRECHYREIFHVYLSAASLILWSVLGEIS